MVVVGAGASIDFGMPSVNGVDTLFCTWAKENYRLACNKNGSLYSYVRDAIENYYRLNEIRFEAYTNFEEVLYVLLQLSKMVTNSESSFPINAFLEMKSFPQIIHDHVLTSVDGSHFSELASYLVDKLLERFRSRCGVIDLESENFQKFSGFINRLNREFNTVFISVNYDNLITQACQGLFTGFNGHGSFDASAFYSHSPFDRSPCGSIYHLHGSVHFDMVATDRALHEVTWNNDLSVSQNSSGRNYGHTTERTPILTSSIIAGYGKSNQIQRVPFRNYYSVLDQVALDADAFLFLGYGFADQHLNNAFYPVASSEKPVVVIDHADIGQDTLSLGRQDAWSQNLLKLFPCSATSGGPTMSEVKDDRQQTPGFETLQRKKSKQTLSVFYNGFLGALSCENSVNTIMERLGRTG
jgi:hypothetical protein